MRAWRLRSVVNAANGSTLLGLGLAAAGAARVSRGPRGLVLATEFTIGFPPGSAFAVGDVVLTRHDAAWLEARPRLLVHEERHAWQYVKPGPLRDDVLASGVGAARLAVRRLPRAADAPALRRRRRLVLPARG